MLPRSLRNNKFTSAASAGSKSARGSTDDGNMPLRTYSLLSAAGNLSARGSTGLQWTSLHGRPVIGRDCQPEVAQRVVGLCSSALKSMGLGTIVNVDGCTCGFAAVRWDRERGSARPAAEYPVGHNGVYLLELAQLEDMILGQRYESTNGWQGTCKSIEDLFNEPFGGPSRKRRFKIKQRLQTISDSQKDSLTDTGAPHPEFLKQGHGKSVNNSAANFKSATVIKCFTDLFVRFAKGSKRKRTWGYNIFAAKPQTMQSMSHYELVQCLKYLDARQDKSFLRGDNPILSHNEIILQYQYYSRWSHPDAVGELDFDRFAICLDAIAMLVGIPVPRFLCVPPHKYKVRGVISDGSKPSQGHEGEEEIVGPPPKSAASKRVGTSGCKLLDGSWSEQRDFLPVSVGSWRDLERQARVPTKSYLQYTVSFEFH